MEKKLNVVLQRMDSKQLSKLWLFYRYYFKTDEDCLDFIYAAVVHEPVYTDKEQMELFFKAFEEKNYVDPNDSLFIPHRMLNCVERMVSASRDMEHTQQGKDVFKIVLLISCSETLQTLGGKRSEKFLDFLECNTSTVDKDYIREHFMRVTKTLYSGEDGFWQFANVLREYRNAAAHEGLYWETCFKNTSNQVPIMITTKLKPDDKEKGAYLFETNISYQEFEEIFVRSCISFIKNYVSNQEATHADT